MLQGAHCKLKTKLQAVLATTDSQKNEVSFVKTYRSIAKM
jgi:hypothetical protein